MKKFITTLFLLVCIVSITMAYTPSTVTTIDARSNGMGGIHASDTSTFYTLYGNPAGLAFAGKKTLLPDSAFNLGGPLTELVDLVKGLASSTSTTESNEMTDQLLGLIGENGLNLNLKFGSPLNFGHINHGFGWGVIQNLEVKGTVPSLTKSNIGFGGDLAVVMGYAYPLTLPVGQLSFGATGKFLGSIEMVYTGAITDLENFDTNTMPTFASYGFGFDLGVQYRLSDLLVGSLVWKDVFTTMFTSEYLGVDALSAQNKTGESFKTILNSKLAVGIGCTLPVQKFTLGILSDLNMYLDYNDFMPLFRNDPFGRNPVLEIAFGAEVSVLKVFAVRVGMNECYPSAGLGLKLGKLKIDAAVYGRELGLEPGANPQLNATLGIGMKY
jgi:hypothetical protein